MIYTAHKRFLVTQAGFDGPTYLENELSVSTHLARILGKFDENGVDALWLEKVEKQAKNLKLFQEIFDPLTGITILRVGV